MNSTLLLVLENAFWCSMASLGFSVLFQTPRKALLYIVLGGFVAGVIKFGILKSGLGLGIVVASLTGALFIGFASIAVAHWSHFTVLVIAIPSVISYVPGSFAFKAMMGLLKFVRHAEAEVLIQTVHHATMAFFVILAIALGVTFPMLLLRAESLKHFRVSAREKNKKS